MAVRSLFPGATGGPVSLFAPAQVASAAPAQQVNPIYGLLSDQSFIRTGDAQGAVNSNLVSGYYLGDKFLGNYFDPSRAAAVNWKNNNASGNYMTGLAQTTYGGSGGMWGDGSDGRAEYAGGSYIPGSRPIFDKSGNLSGYQVADAATINTSTSRRQNSESRQYTNADWMKQNITPSGKDAYGNDTFYIAADKASDPNFGWNWSHYRGDQQGGSGLGGLLTGALLTAALGPAGLGLSGMTAGAVAGGMTSAMNGGNVLKGAALGGLTGGADSLAGSLASATGMNSGLANALTRGGIGLAGTAMNGGNLNQALLNGLASGAGSYAGQQVSGLLGNSVPTWVRSGLSGAASAGAGSLLRGGDVGQALQYGLLSGAASGAGNQMASGVTNPFLRGLVQGSPNAVLSLYRNRG